jgi:hypothetical protein
MEMSIKEHDNGKINERVYAEALAGWEVFFLFNDVVTGGCDDNDHVAMEAHAQELDNLGDVSMAAYLEVAIDIHMTVYMHIMACYIGDFVREWGGLMKLRSQGAEAMHQMTKYKCSEALSKEGECVSGCAHPSAHPDEDANPAITQATGAAHRQACHMHRACVQGQKGGPRADPKQAPIRVPAHNFNESCAVKRGRGDRRYCNVKIYMSLYCLPPATLGR